MKSAFLFKNKLMSDPLLSLYGKKCELMRGVTKQTQMLPLKTQAVTKWFDYVNDAFTVTSKTHNK